MMSPTILETDVLVVGGGLAALRAALEAVSTGARTTVAVKRRLGQSGSSANTSGGYAATHPAITPQDSWQRHYADTLKGGARLNDRTLARVLCQEAGARLDDLLRLGAAFLRQNGGYHLSPSGDHSFPRVLVPVHMRGTDMTLPLREAVLASGIQVLENTLVVDLLVDDDRAAGVVAVARDRRELLVIRAKDVILGAGGAGRLFQITSNPIDVTGDGFALALRAGIPLRDMEMIQFYPWRCIRPFKNARVPVQPSTFVVGGKLYNARGERFMVKYDSEKKDSTTRDVAARGIFDQIRFGLSVEDGVILDLSDVTDEDFRKTNMKVIERLEPRKIYFRDVQMIIAPEAHFFMGGVLIDEMARSPVAGLSACGENAGGIHGGNRLNSNAIPDTQVFGARAGRTAGEDALRRDVARVDDRPVKGWAGRLEALASDDRVMGERLAKERADLQRAMWLALGIVRTGDGLQQGLRYVEGLRERLLANPPASLGELEATIEMENLCDTAEACALSALHRTESRGAHYREDFPQTNDREWLKSILIARGAGGTYHLETVPLDTSEDERYLGGEAGKEGLKLIEGEFVE